MLGANGCLESSLEDAQMEIESFYLFLCMFVHAIVMISTLWTEQTCLNSCGDNLPHKPKMDAFSPVPQPQLPPTLHLFLEHFPYATELPPLGYSSHEKSNLTCLWIVYIDIDKDIPTAMEECHPPGSHVEEVCGEKWFIATSIFACAARTKITEVSIQIINIALSRYRLCDFQKTARGLNIHNLWHACILQFGFKIGM